MTRLRTTIYLLVAFALALALSLYAHRASASQTFSGPGLFIDSGCADILNPVDGQTWCFDPAAKSLSVWNSTTGAYQDPFVATFTLDFNNFSLFGVGGLGLAQLSAPGSVAAAGTCSGTCATTYTYEVSCVNDSGETTPSPSVTATNAASLSASSFNTVTWATQAACSGGYNVYGRTSGSLGLLANVAVGTGSFTDDGSANAPTSYAFTFSSSAGPSLVIWDLRGTSVVTAPNQPIDVSSSNSGISAALKATSVTTSFNHDLQIPVFGMGKNAGAFTAPGGFSNVANVIAATNTHGIWGGTKDIATAGATGAATGTTVNSSNWGAFNIAVTAASPSVAVTVVGSATATASSPFTSLPFTDPVGTAAGDLEVACVAFFRGTFLSAPQGFTLIGTVAPASTGTQISCYWNLPQGIALPPTTNTTGIISQSTASGTYRETLLGLQSWSANSANAPNGALGVIQSSISYPVDMKVQSCRATWFQYAGCSPFPVFAIKDTTAGSVLCSSGTVSGTDTDKAVTPSNFSVPANDVIAFLATTAGTSCSAGQSAMSIVLHE